MLFGVTPRGDVVGQQVSERTVEEVSAEFQRIDPPAFPEIERLRVAGGLEVIAVHVNRGASPPYGPTEVGTGLARPQGFMME